jgi:hypothetical protein
MRRGNGRQGPQGGVDALDCRHRFKVNTPAAGVLDWRQTAHESQRPAVAMTELVGLRAIRHPLQRSKALHHDRLHPILLRKVRRRIRGMKHRLQGGWISIAIAKDSECASA